MSMIIGLDLAKHIFQVHCVDAAGKVVLRKRLRRSEVTHFFAALEPCLIGIEACGSGHHWARELRRFGHDVRLMPPQYVRIQRLPELRTLIAAANPDVLPELAKSVLLSLIDQIDAVNVRVSALERKLIEWHRTNVASQRLTTIPGIGPITATAIAATVCDAARFSSARQFAAWIGLVPRQHSSGGRERMGGLSKRGDGYLRRLLVHGARAVIRWQRRGNAYSRPWLAALLGRRHVNVAAAALANKNARIAWALLTKEETYTPTKQALPAAA
jgi:transposase